MKVRYLIDYDGNTAGTEATVDDARGCSLQGQGVVKILERGEGNGQGSIMGEVKATKRGRKGAEERGT